MRITGVMATAIRFYFDEMMARPLAEGLEQREIDVIMAVDVGMTGQDDDTGHLPYATEQDAVLVTLDRAFAGRSMQRDDHAGMICWTGRSDDIGGIVRALTEFAETHTPEDAAGQVFWLK